MVSLVRDLAPPSSMYIPKAKGGDGICFCYCVTDTGCVCTHIEGMLCIAWSRTCRCLACATSAAVASPDLLPWAPAILSFYPAILPCYPFLLPCCLLLFYRVTPLFDRVTPSFYRVVSCYFTVEPLPFSVLPRSFTVLPLPFYRGTLPFYLVIPPFYRVTAVLPCYPSLLQCYPALLMFFFCRWPRLSAGPCACLAPLVALSARNGPKAWICSARSSCFSPWTAGGFVFIHYQ